MLGNVVITNMAGHIHRIVKDAQNLDGLPAMRRDAEHEKMAGIPSKTPGMEDEGLSCDIISRPDADDGRPISQRIECGMNDLGVGSGLSITELVRSPIDDTPKVRLGGLG